MLQVFYEEVGPLPTAQHVSAVNLSRPPDYVINNCALYSPPGGEVVLFNVSPETKAWLKDTELVI